MAADIPTIEPSEVRAGDTWKWTKSLPDYPASAWTLKYRFKSALGGFEITATADGADHSVEVSASTTAGYHALAGIMSWVAWVEGGTSEKYTVDSGVSTINPDYRNGTSTAALDDRSDARVIYDGLMSAYQSAVTSRAFVAEYEIAGRRMKFESRAGWLKEINYWKSRVDAETAAEALKNGLATGRRIQFRI